MPQGERLRVSVPHGHWKTTFIGALTMRGFIAPFVIDRPINRVNRRRESLSRRQLFPPRHRRWLDPEALWNVF